MTVGGSQADALPPSSELVPPVEHSESAPSMVIWGTDVSVNQVKSKFSRFVNAFVDEELADDEMFEGLYPTLPFYLLDEINTILEPFLNVNMGHNQKYIRRGTLPSAGLLPSGGHPCP